MNLLSKYFTALSIWALCFIIGYCFGGQTGIGIAAIILLLVQIIPYRGH